MGSGLYGLLGHVGAVASCKTMFLGLLPWNQYLDVTRDTKGICTVNNFHLLGGDSSLLLIGLAVVDDLLRVAGLLAVLFMIYAGVKFILSNGAPDEAAKARTTALNALIGLAITMVAVAFVSYLGAKLGGSGQGGSSPSIDLSSLPNPLGVANGSIVQTALSIAFGVIGALSFLVIVIAGFRYVLSQGDPQAASTAKNTIIYALVGLVLAIVAQSIVSLVVSRS